MIKKLGHIFAEELVTGTNNSSKYHQNRMHPAAEEVDQQTTGFHRRILILFLLTGLVCLILLGRLFYLMVVEGAKNRELSDNNRIKLIRLPAPRGIIYDRNHVALVRNAPIYREKLKDGSLHPITQEEALALESGSKNSNELIVSTGRQYIFDKQMAHVLGYLTETTESELQDQSNILSNYLLGDKTGRLGIEEFYEKRLKGVDGKELVEVDATGRVIKKIGVEQPEAGRDVVLTLDYRLQSLLAANFPQGEKGAIVASDPDTGEILGLYSSPSFDPNVFTMAESRLYAASNSAMINQLLTDQDSPLFDRVIGGTYPSGSIFKIITSMAGLENNIINVNTEIEDVGEIVIGPFRFPNWYFLQYGGKESFVNIIKAIKRSNDIFFYKVGEMVGLDKLVEMAKKFGLSQRTGVDLPHEAKGLMPDENWKRQYIGDNWYLGDTYHLSIGQGYLLTTPIQLNQITNVIASGGKLCKPHLLLNQAQSLNLKSQSLYCQDLNLKKENIDLVREGMREACSTGGTAWPFFDFAPAVIPSPAAFSVIPSPAEGGTRDLKHMDVGCKTGTAEYGDPKNKTHAWFTVFAPFENPKISITVLVEGAGEGSNISAPVAKKVLEEWLR